MAAVHSLDIQFGLQHLELINALSGRGGAVRKNLVGQGKGYRKKVLNGTSSNQIDLGYFRDTPTAIAASGNQDFDLAGSLTDSFGTTITMAKVCGILVLNWNTAGTLSVTRPAANGLSSVFIAASDGVIVGRAADSENPGIFFVWHPTGGTVTAGTVDLINLINNDASNAANYTIGLFGRTA
jgi:hypothetical protein